MIAREDWGEFFDHVDGVEIVFRDHAEGDHFCALVVRMIRHAQELQDELKALGFRGIGNDHWKGPKGAIEVSSTV